MGIQKLSARKRGGDFGGLNFSGEENAADHQNSRTNGKEMKSEMRRVMLMRKNGK